MAMASTVTIPRQPYPVTGVITASDGSQSLPGKRSDELTTSMQRKRDRVMVTIQGIPLTTHSTPTSDSMRLVERGTTRYPSEVEGIRGE
jgi:hypothetical protein